MTNDEAKQILKYHSFLHENPNEPKMTTGFLGALRPFQGTLTDDNFHEIMKCLKVLANEFENNIIEQEVVSALWGICHYSRAWALYNNGMLQRNNLLTQEQIEILDIWICMISYAVTWLLEGNVEEAFFEYNEYLSERNTKHIWTK